MSMPRGAFCKFREFTPHQRERFQGILKMDQVLVDKYIDLVQRHVPIYFIETRIMLDTPPEPAEETQKCLERIARYTRDLWDELENIDPDGAGYRLELAQLRFPSPSFELDQFKHDLMYFAAIARGTSQWPSERGPGRPRSIAHHEFISKCVKDFENVFGQKPKFTKGTKFQNFLKAVSDEVCPPGVVLSGDITNLIKAAIE